MMEKAMFDNSNVRSDKDNVDDIVVEDNVSMLSDEDFDAIAYAVAAMFAK